MARLVGLLVAVLVLLLVGTGPALAQQATPPAEVGPSWLVVQAFEAATLRPDPTAGTYTLTLEDVDAAVLAFTDRPDRLVAYVPTPDFVQAVAGAQADPLNATLAASPADGMEAMVVVALLSAEHDATTGTVTYRVTLLGGEDGALAGVATPLATPGAEHVLGPGHLFVDSVQVPTHIPVNVCGNTVEPVGILNPAFGNTCVND